MVEWIAADYTYIVTKSDTEARETKYKCVVVYNDILLSRIFTITNYSSNYEIRIESDKGEQFYYDIGNPTLTCLINDQEQTSGSYSYQWAELDNNNNFYSLSETSIDNTIYNNAVAGYNSLKASIAAETAMPAASQAQLNEYLTIINRYDKIMRIEGNKIHHLQVNTITNFATYKCSVYKNGVYIGTSSITIKNDLNKKDAYTLVINNGSQTFKYNEAGVSPASTSLDNPQIILPLSFTVFDNLGNAIEDDVINKCNIEWSIPTENTMLKALDNENQMYFNYTIRDKYDVRKTDNNIKLKVDYKGMNLVAETDFTFVKEGEPGTNGTEFVCKIVPNTTDVDYGYPMILNGVLNYTPRQTNKWFNVQLWHSGTKIFEGSSTGNTIENKSATVKWSILKNKYTTSIYDTTSLSVSDDGIFNYSSYQGANSPANIIKVTITYDNIEYYTTFPMITATAASGYGVSLVEDSGFRYATYSADGRKPQYDNSNPFELKVTKVINGTAEDISNFTTTHAVNYDWHIKGRLYNPVNSSWVNSLNLGVYNRTDISLARCQASYKPLDNFNGECVTNGLECIVLNNSAAEVARIHIPVHLLLNKYGHAAINGWDGNSVSIDKNGNGVILAPQIGAGQKENDNSFTGILMGSVKEAGKNTQDTGLFGYNAGARSIFLNAKDGSAIFGKKGPGQIILDPAAQKAMLYSSAYWKNYNDDGKPSSYASANKNNQGMLIDLTTPLIEWGNGNFKVDVNGHLTAKGGGTIAGFNIDDDSIYTGTKSSSSNVRLSSANGKFSRIINGTNRANLHFAINNNFAIDSNGALYSASGQIAKFNISSSKLVGGTGSSTVALCSTMGDEWAIWAGASAGANAPFHVGHDGSLYSTKGVIGGWTINGTELLSNDGNIHITCAGTLRGPNWEINANGNATFNDIVLTQSGYGRNRNLIDFNNFTVDRDGTMTATNGKFGGSITGSSISGGSINGADITGSTIDISANGGYLRMGAGERWTKHPLVSGLNCEGGIDMNGHGITYLGDLVGSGTTNFSAKKIYIRATDGAGNIVFYNAAATESISILNIARRLHALDGQGPNW